MAAIAMLIYEYNFRNSKEVLISIRQQFSTFHPLGGFWKTFP